MTIPEKLTHPALDAYPYINLKFNNCRTYDVDVELPYRQPSELWGFDDRYFARLAFPTAEEVDSVQVAPLRAMSDGTFGRLVSGFNASVNDVAIRNRADLVTAASFTADEHAMATPEQLQAFLLYGSRHEFQVHWGQVVDLYNESAPDQQKSIFDFFNDVLNRSLVDLLSTRGPGPLPDGLQPVLKTKQSGRDTLVFCETFKDWIRDDLLASRFAVEGRVRRASNTFHLIAFGSSLDEAVARATLFATTLDRQSEVYRIQISLQDQVIATTDLLSAGKKTSNPENHKLPVRLEWDIYRSGPDVSSERLQKSLIAAEAFFGLRWSKIRKLEDDLGL